jgi:hypothetical protein
MTACFNDSEVKICNTTSNLVRFEKKIIPFYYEKTLYVVYYNAGDIVVNSEAIGLASGA